MKLYENPAFSHLEPSFVRQLQEMIDISARKVMLMIHYRD